MVTVSDPAEPVKVNVHETLQVVVNVVATQSQHADRSLRDRGGFYRLTPLPPTPLANDDMMA